MEVSGSPARPPSREIGESATRTKVVDLEASAMFESLGPGDLLGPDARPQRPRSPGGGAAGPGHWDHPGQPSAGRFAGADEDRSQPASGPNRLPFAGIDSNACGHLGSQHGCKATRDQAVDRDPDPFAKMRKKS